MGQSTRGIYPEKDGLWEVDKWKRGTRFRQCGFQSYAEAESWLIRQLNDQREAMIHGSRVDRTFDQAAAHYITLHEAKTSLETEIFMLNSELGWIVVCRSFPNDGSNSIFFAEDFAHHIP